MAITTDAHGSRHLTNSGATETTGKVGNAAYIGSGNLLSLASDAGIEFVGADFYCCAWLKFNATPSSWEVPATKRPGATTGGEWQVRIGPGTSGLLQAVFYGTGGDVLIDSDLTPTVGVWYFVEWGVKDTGTTGFICINRGTDATSAVAVDEAGTSLYIGSDGAGNSLNGSIDQFAIFSIVPDASGRNSIYNSGAGRAYADLSSTTGLVAFYELGGASSTGGAKNMLLLGVG